MIEKEVVELSTISIKVPSVVADKMIEVFTELSKLSKPTIIKKLILDELGDFDIFDSKYYNEKDIEQIFGEMIK